MHRFLVFCSLPVAFAFFVQEPSSNNKSDGVRALRSTFYSGVVDVTPGTRPRISDEPQFVGLPIVRTDQSLAMEDDVQSIWETANQVTVQGGSLRTCSLGNSVRRVMVAMKTDGRPLNADVDLWCGPGNTPYKMKVSLENGALRPFTAIVETPRLGGSNAIAIRNTANIEFPMQACLDSEMADNIAFSYVENPRNVQGGSVMTKPFPPEVASVQAVLRTDGRPLNARIELLQGPNNSKQTVDIYTEDGTERPFTCIIETPGNGNTVRIVNTATIEYPFTASVEAYTFQQYDEYGNGPLLTWDS